MRGLIAFPGKNRLRLATTLATTLGLFAFSACSSAADTSTDASASPDNIVERKLVVYAAASLKSSFETIATDFEKENPGVTVALDTAGSSDLAGRILEGAPAAVFASADEKNMTKVTDGGLNAGEPQLFTRNTLVIAVPRGDPGAINSIADFGDTSKLTVVCQAQVPCGAVSLRVAEDANVTLTPVSEESSVSDVLTKVASGEVDGGLVYRTDAVKSKDSVDYIELNAGELAETAYPIVALKAAEDAELAPAFTDYVLSDAGQKVLADAGFDKP